MNSLRQSTQSILERAHSLELPQTQVVCTSYEMDEYELTGRTINLARSLVNSKVQVKTVLGGKQATAGTNSFNAESIDNLFDQLGLGLKSSPVDEGYAILETPTKGEFKRKEQGHNPKDLLDVMLGFSDWMATDYPALQFESSQGAFVSSTQSFLNSNQVDLSAKESFYKFSFWFTGKTKERTSSFNGIGFKSEDLPSLETMKSKLTGYFDLAYRELESPVKVASPKAVLLAPTVVPDFLEFLLGQIASSELIAGTSLLKDKLNSKVVSEKLSIESNPILNSNATFQPYSKDGVLLKNGLLIENGKLNSFLIDLYGSRKLKKPISDLSSSHLRIKPGTETLRKIIENLDETLLLVRFSGGSPSSNGDFSGVAKNSFWIQKGEITSPVQESMIAGNIISVLNSVEKISLDTFHFGDDEFPWILASL